MGTQGGKEASSLNSCPLQRDPQGGDPVVSWGRWDTPRVSPGIVGIIIICNQNIIIFHGREIQDDIAASPDLEDMVHFDPSKLYQLPSSI